MLIAFCLNLWFNGFFKFAQSNQLLVLFTEIVNLFWGVFKKKNPSVFYIHLEQEMWKAFNLINWQKRLSYFHWSWNLYTCIIKYRHVYILSCCLIQWTNFIQFHQIFGPRFNPSHHPFPFKEKNRISSIDLELILLRWYWTWKAWSSFEVICDFVIRHSHPTGRSEFNSCMRLESNHKAIEL